MWAEIVVKRAQMFGISCNKGIEWYWQMVLTLISSTPDGGMCSPNCSPSCLWCTTVYKMLHYGISARTLKTCLTAWNFLLLEKKYNFQSRVVQLWSSVDVEWREIEDSVDVIGNAFTVWFYIWSIFCWHLYGTNFGLGFSLTDKLIQLSNRRGCNM